MSAAYARPNADIAGTGSVYLTVCTYLFCPLGNA